MTHGESDSWSIRTLLLLQSSSPDSPHAMRDMLCEAIQTKYGTRRLKPVPPLQSPSSPTDPEDLGSYKPKKTEYQRANVPDENTNNGNGSGTDCSDLEMEMSCCLCKSVLFRTWNPIVECADCHAGYHKECHDPEIMEDVSDPRVVWYCRNCSKSMQNRPKSMPTITSPNTLKPVSSSSKNSSLANRKSSTPPTSPSYSSKTSFGGKRPLQNKLSVLSSTSGKLQNPKINIISADRRLQIMKKRAARKQDKRSNK